MEAALDPGPERDGRRERNKRAKWVRIERAARAEFARHGFEAAALRAIAKRARVATGTLFLYARDKRELLFLVFQDEARRIFADARLAVRDETSLVAALMELFGRFLDFYARDAELSAAILREFFFRPYEPERLGALTREYGALVAELVDAARARGELRSDVPAAGRRQCALRPLRLLGADLARQPARVARAGGGPAPRGARSPDRRTAPPPRSRP
jgi:AcrR family transcriptional regulator